MLDEADRMLDMGFWPDVQRILAALPASRQTLLFSATMPGEVLKLTQEFLREPKYIQVGRRGGPAQTISHAVQTMPSSEKTQWLARWLRDDAIGPVLVFCRTKIGAERLAQRLSGMGIRAASLHADRTQQQRMAAVEGFRTGTYPCWLPQTSPHAAWISTASLTSSTTRCRIRPRRTCIAWGERDEPNQPETPSHLWRPKNYARFARWRKPLESNFSNGPMGPPAEDPTEAAANRPRTARSPTGAHGRCAIQFVPLAAASGGRQRRILHAPRSEALRGHDRLRSRGVVRGLPVLQAAAGAEEATRRIPL